MNYAALSLSEASGELQNIARDTRALFGGLGARQLNWRPNEIQWSVAQCFQHLLTANELVLDAARNALAHSPTSIWQRVPLLPKLFGQALIRSQAPGGSRKYTAPVKAQPTTSDIPGDIIERFVGQQRDAAAWMQTIGEHDAARAILISPFIRFVTYSVLDGCRLIVAHDHRHFEQARRVTELPAFPRN